MAVVMAGEGESLVLAREARPAEGDGADTNPSIGPILGGARSAPDAAAGAGAGPRPRRAAGRVSRPPRPSQRSQIWVRCAGILSKARGPTLQRGWGGGGRGLNTWIPLGPHLPA